MNPIDIGTIRPWQRGDADSRCQNCGREYEPWFTDDRLWNRVVGGEEGVEASGYLCPICFQRAAEIIYPNLVWRFTPEWSPKYSYSPQERYDDAWRAYIDNSDVIRLDGGMICSICGRPFQRHIQPLKYENPTIRILCDGRVAKL